MRIALTLLLSFVALTSLTSCLSTSSGGGTTGTTETCTSGTDVTETLTLLNGATPLSCTTNIAADAPDWIKNNFHCVTVQTCSTSYKFIINSLPPYKTNYYSAASGNRIAWQSPGTDGSTRTKNPNTIASQSITMYVPKTPTYKSSGHDSTKGSGLDCVGVTTYGVCIFNNEAAPGDSLATEFASMDYGDGHPQNTGKYHHHTEPQHLTDDDNSLIGVMLDGYPVYGKRKQDNSYPTLNATTHTTSCTTTHFPSGTYCYHVTNGTGVAADIIGSYFQGSKGTVQ